MSSVATLHPHLRSALRERLLGLSGIPTEFHWEGEAYTATAGTPFLREKLIPAGSNPRGLGSGGSIAHRTAFLLTLFYPPGEGNVEIELAAGRLLEAFAPGRSPLIWEDTAATVTQAERSDLEHGPDWARCAVTISTLAFTAT